MAPAAAQQPAYVQLPPLPLNSGFGLEFARDSAPGYAGLSLRLIVDNAATGARAVLTEADAAVSGGGLVVTFAKPVAWTAATLPPGEYVALLFVNGTYECGVAFACVLPPAGSYTPP